MQTMDMFSSEDIWLVSFKDLPVFSIDRISGYVEILNKHYLPFDCIISDKTSIASLVQNITMFNSWCAKRVLTLDRKYAKEILNYYGFTQSVTDSERAEIALTTHCVSLNDCFWAKKVTDSSSWETVNLFTNSLKDTIFEIALLGHSFTMTTSELITPDLNTDGTAPKAWIRKDDGFYLLKGDTNDSVIREVEASQILNELGIKTVIYSLYSFKDQPVSKCKCFTGAGINLVRAGVYAEWCRRNSIHFIDILKKYKKSYDLMNIADFLVGNSDQHPNNWGFLYDDEMNIFSMNVLMDYDHAFLGKPTTISSPSLFTRGRVSQKQVAIDTIGEYKDLINWDVDLSKYKYGYFVKERLAILESNLV